MFARVARRHSWIAVAAAALTVACAGAPPPPAPIAVPAAMPPRTALRVALFPYIPDAAGDGYRGLLAWIDSAFEARAQWVDLQLRPLNPDDDFYNLDTLGAWLGGGPGTYDVVEVDAVLLGDLVRRSLVQTWSRLDTADWHPAARFAASVGGSYYGIPHWLCSYFLFTRQAPVHGASSVEGLLRALGRADTVGRRPLVGNFHGSWETPAYYLDAFGETRGWRAVPSALTPILDTTVLFPLLRTFRFCGVGAANPCLSGGYEADPAAARILARDSAVALIGYSERMFYVQHFAPPGLSPVLLSAAPVGNSSAALLFVDVLARNARCGGYCAQASELFAAFLNDPGTVASIVLSADAGPGAVPRYLLPATVSAYQSPRLRSDPYYPTLWRAIQHSGPLPNAGLPALRKAMRDSIVAAFNRLQ